MIQKLKGSLDLTLYTLGIGTAFILLFLSNKLLTPIKGRNFLELKEEMIGNFSSSLANLFRKAFGKTLLPIDESYSVFGNIFIPMVFLIIASLIFLLIIFSLGKSVVQGEDTISGKIIKILLALFLFFILFMTIHSGWNIFVLNFKMALVIGTIALLIFGFISNPSRNS